MPHEPPKEPPSARPTASAFGEDGYLWRLNVPKGGYEYQAFHAPREQRPDFLVLVRRDKAHSCPEYSRLENIEFDPGGTWVMLMYSFEVVKIDGRNLFPVAAALLSKQAEIVTQFDPKLYRPLLEDKPIITEIDVYVTRPASQDDVTALSGRIARLERALKKSALEDA